ncbi:MAG: hypothetical protein H0T47_02295 [Planctomycetaceae bacterium]|nr:hypothetical protein [Planctomycetaceae bacterium]
MAASAVGFLVLAFILFSSLALGAATAWFVVWKSRKPTLWMLTPLFAFFWLMLVGAPMVGLGLYLPYRAAMRAPVIVAPVPVPVQEVPETPPSEVAADRESEPLDDAITP